MYVNKLSADLIQVVRLFRVNEEFIIEVAKFAPASEYAEASSCTFFEGQAGAWKPMNISNPAGEASTLLVGTYYDSPVKSGYVEVTKEDLIGAMPNYSLDIGHRIQNFITELGI